MLPSQFQFSFAPSRELNYLKRSMKSYWNSMSGTIPITLSILIFFIYSYEDVFATPSMHLCRPEQRDVLLQLKNEFQILNSSFSHDCTMNGNYILPSRKMESWANYSDCCSWKGITCNAKSGEVTGLDLSGSCIHGRIHSNSSLQNLHSLTTLDLSFNGLSGEIMSWIGNLSYLDISRNNFNGQIPSSLANLSYLTFLDLSSNNFWGPIPSSFGNLSHLTSLHLSYNHISGLVPSFIGNLSRLTSLSLDDNDLSGEIPFTIGKLSQLSSLNLAYNNFVGQIPSSFRNLNQLTVLFVDSNMLSGKLPIALLNLTSLSYLSISGNRFIDTLPPNVTSLSNLKFLNAGGNAFTGTLPSSLFNIPSLAALYLEHNQLNGTLDFGNISSTTSKLQVLHIGYNNFIGPIPSSISKLTNLVELDLSNFNNQGPVDFSIFYHLKSLRSLRLRYLNTTTTVDLNDILSYIKRLSSLDLSGNHVSATNKSSVSYPSPQLRDLYLSDCGLTDFPDLLRSQQFMINLDISNNNIKGQVPAWLWTQTDPNYMNISYNALTGFERSRKHGLYVKYLFGSNNKFAGKIPSFVCAFPSLTILDLSNNNFNGSIPRCLANLKSTLSELNLRQNRLHGGLPESIFERLRSLDVGHNRLVGKLPRSFAHFSELEVLNVENNRINDTFPSWLSSLQKLQVLVIRSNAFHGPIHQASFPKLRIIDISRNHFSGSLPKDYFVKWSAMSSLGTNPDYSNEKYMGLYVYYSMVLMNRGLEMELVRILKIYTAIDFSGNELEGEIPKSIGLLKEVHVLNLSNNVFTGYIPSSLGNLTALESLDVSQNKLSGEIPQELGNLSFLAFMNFSHNKLSGLVPGGTQFRRQNCSSFEDNMGLFGPSLDEICRDIHTPESQQNHETEEEDEDEEVLNWKAAGIGSIPGIVFGLTIGYILASYKPEWFIVPFGRNNSRSISRLSRPT